MIPKIQNVVSTANLECNLNLREIALRLDNVEYNPSRFSALILRLRKPKTSILIFNNGRLVCTGAKSIKDSRAAIRRVARLIQRLGFNVALKSFKIQNIVASCNMGYTIDLTKLTREYPHLCTYNPEIFPGVKLRLEELNITQLVFTSGKIVITGAKVKKAIVNAFEATQPILVKFKKNLPLTI